MNTKSDSPTIAERAGRAVTWLVGATVIVILVCWLAYPIGEGERRHLEQTRICALQVDYADCMAIRTDDRHYPFKLARKMDYDRGDSLERATMRNEDCDLPAQRPYVKQPSPRSFPHECVP